MTEEQVLYKKENGVAIVTINRPEKLNALTMDMEEKLLHSVVEEIRNDEEVRVAVLTGAGRAFCAGIDVNATLGRTNEERNEANIRRLKNNVANLRSNAGSMGFDSITKPTIAAINGPAVGLGAEITLQCDIRIAAESARIGWVFVQRGWVPDLGAGTFLLPRIIGLSKACELVFTGDIIDAKEMFRIGLVSQLVPDDELMPAAIALANRLKSGAPLAIQMAKQLIYRGLERNLESHFQFNSTAFQTLTQTQDHLEGMKAFVEKRPPHWQYK